MKKRALILIHPGFEEMEAAAPIDLLARAGADVIQASTEASHDVEGRNGIVWKATHLFADLSTEHFDVIILPGGPGVKKLRGRSDIIECLQRQHREDALLGCICAGPLMLKDAGLIDGLRYTAHPSTSGELQNAEAVEVAIDKGIITSQGAGTATEFSLAIIEALFNRETAIEIAQAICWPRVLNDQ